MGRNVRCGPAAEAKDDRNRRERIMMARGTRDPGRVKSPRSRFSDPFSLVPAQAGIQGFQPLVLGPRLRGDDDFGCAAGFSYSLGRRWGRPLPQRGLDWEKLRL